MDSDSTAESISKQVQQAQQAFNQGQHDDALALLKQAIESDPNHPTLGLALARMTFQTGDLSGAQTLLSQLPDDQQQSDEGKNLAALFEFSGLIAEAPTMESLQATLQQDPNDLAALYPLAAYLMLHQKIDDAIACLFHSIRIDKSDHNGRAQQLLLKIFSLLQNDHPQQINAYRRQLQGILF